MNRTSILGYVVVCLIIGPSPGIGQTATEVAADYLDALAEERWIDAAKWVHPETAAFLQAATLARYECPTEGPFPTFEEYRAMQPGLPLEVAERSYAELTRRWDEQVSIPDRFPGTRDIAELRELSLREFVARYLAGESRLGGEGPRAYHPAVVLGEVREREWVNVLYRFAYELEEQDPSGEIGFYRPAPRVIRLRTDGAGRPWIAWGLHGPHASGNIFGPGVLPSIRVPTCPSSSP